MSYLIFKFFFYLFIFAPSDIVSSNDGSGSNYDSDSSFDCDSSSDSDFSHDSGSGPDFELYGKSLGSTIFLS